MNPEEIKPYSGEGAKGKQVEAMFDNIAPAYDFMNSAMSFGLHRRWLSKALRTLPAPADLHSPRIIDLATGTGDVALELARRYPEGTVTGVDLSEGMLAVARSKAQKENAGERIVFLQGDCLDLDFPDNSFDILTIAYGVRNFENLAKGFSEFQRVLRPGGRLMILELSRPENRLVRFFYDIYARGIIPLIGRLVSRDSRAYTYLPQSIAAMPSRKRVEEMLGEAGFGHTASKPLTLGVVTCYSAQKPSTT